MTAEASADGRSNAGGRPAVRIRTEALALGILAAIPLAKFLSVTLGTAVLSGGDHAWINLPFKAFTREALASGFVPLWNKSLSCGTPHLAQGEAGVFYPGNILLYTPLDLVRAYGWTVLAHVVALSWATYGLLRCHGARPHVAGTLAALVSISPYVLFNLPTSNAAQAWWLVPGILLAWEWARRGSAWKAGVLGGVLVAQPLLLGRPEILVYGGMTLAAIGTTQVALAESRARCAGRLASFGVASLAVGIGLAAVQLLPTLEFLPLSSRGSALQADFSEAGAWLSVPRLFALMLFPAFPDDPGTYTAYHTANPFIGAVPLALMLLGSFDAVRRDRARTLPIVVGAAFSLILAMGPDLPIRGLWTLPPLSALRYPGRALPVFLCLASLLAARGWERVTRRDRRPSRGEVIVAGAVLVLGLAAYALQADEVVAPQVALGHLGLQLAPLGAVAAWGALRRRRRAWDLALVAACLAQAAPLFAFYGEFVQPRDEFLAAFRPLRTVADSEPGERNVVVSGMRLPGSQAVNPPSLGNGSLMIGASVVNEFNQFTWGPWRELMRRTLHLQASGRVPPPPEPALCDLLGIRWIYRSDERPWTDADWEPVAAGPGGGTALWRRRVGPGRVAWVQGIERRPEPDAEEIVALVRSGADFRTVILVGDPAAPQPGDPLGAGEVAIEERDAGPNAFRFEVQAPAAGYLVVRDHLAPGWEAAIDGRAAPIYRVNAFFKAVFVEPGRHRVDLAYRPRSFRTGATLSVVTGACVIVLLGVSWSRRRRSGATGPGGGTAHSTSMSKAPV